MKLAMLYILIFPLIILGSRPGPRSPRSRCRP